MDFTEYDTGRQAGIITLFTESFTASEGAEEGALIGQLVRDILSRTSKDDLRVFLALEAGKLTGAVAFTRMTFPEDPRRVVLLSPMAVAPDQQGKGVGQGLLRHALTVLRDAGEEVALTYGDIRFYSKSGFARISADMAQPPLPLTYPEGWLGQSLTDHPLRPLNGPSRCVEAFNNPAIW